MDCAGEAGARTELLRRLLGISFVPGGGAAAAVLYAGVLLVCYAPIVFGGRTLQAPLYAGSSVAPETGVTGRGMVNTFDVDLATPIFYEWPIDRYIGDTLRRGELPLWNPHQGAGAPLVVNYSTRVFFPFQMLLNVSPFVLWDFYFLLRLWIAGWLTYCFLARAGLGWTAAAVGGLLYMLSGVFTWFINLEQFVNPAMLVPLWFLAVEVFVARPDARRAAYGAVAIGLNLLAGQPEVTLYAFIAGGLYGVVRWLTVSHDRDRARAAGAWALIAVSAGFALAAPLLLPFAAHLPLAFHLHHLGGDMGVRDPASPTLAVALFIPTFFELPTFPRYLPDNGRWDWLGGYGGVAAPFLLLAGLAGPAWRKARAHLPSLIFFGGVWIWIVLKNFGVPPFDWIGYLPLFDQVWTPRWAGPTWCFALSAGAAVGLERLIEADDRDRAARVRILLGLAAILLTVKVLAAYATTRLAPVMGPLWPFVWPGAMAGQVVAAVLLGLAAMIVLRLRGFALAAALIGLVLVERWFPIPRGFAPSFLALRLIPVGVGLLAVGFAIFERRFVAQACAVIALIVALALDYAAPVGLPDRRDPAAEPHVVRFLRERGGYDRIMGDRRVIPPNYASAFGLYDVRYVEALAVDWLHRFTVEGLETSPRRWWHALWFIGAPERLSGMPRPSAPAPEPALEPLELDLRARLRGYSFLGVRHIAVPVGMDLNRGARSERERFPIVYQNEVVVYENPGALPRAFVVPDWERAATPAQARTRALSAGFDLSTRAVVEGASPSVGGGRGRAAIAEYRANRVALNVDADGPGLLVLTDTFYPGWRAWVDGRPTEIHRVNGVVRGVFVEGGRHEVVMRFFPPSQAVGLVVGAVALAACVGLACTGVTRIEQSQDAS